jgi:hypothetical protein
MQYNKFDDKTCDKAQGVSEHIDAIRSIIWDIKDNRTADEKFTE